MTQAARCETVMKPKRRLTCLLVVAAALLSSAPHAQAGPYRPTPGTQVLWDRYGVPHVFAKSEPDLFFGFGWAQAKSHGELLAKLYAEARGRAAEVYGPDELKNDRWMAVNDAPRRASLWYAQQAPAFRTDLDAFAAGIDAYVAAHPGAWSPTARRVLPISGVDVIAHAERVFQFIYAAPVGIADKQPPDAFAPPPAKPPHDSAGSNGWAIAPARTADGHAMLLMNPHLPWAPGWSTYYEAQLSAPGVDLYGATQIGLPVLRFVFSDDLGFTHTVNAPNAVTFYQITPAPGGYRFDGATLPFQTRTETLKALQPDGQVTTETLEVRSTVQGPIVAERDGQPLAMRVAGLDRPFALQQYWRMATAHDFAGFQAAVAQLQVPTFNVMYADRDGHIEYLYNGLVPRHAFGDLAYWSRPVPGDTSRTLWTDYLSYAELPKAIDPPGGTVQNSNEPPWDAAWPSVIDPAPYAASIPADKVSLRAARGIRMLGEVPRISFDRLTADKWSTRSELADRVLPDLIAAADRSGDALARQAAGVLARWDRTTDADSRGALLFLKWCDAPGGLSGYSPKGFAQPKQLDQPLTTPWGLADPAAAVQALDLAARGMMATYGALDTPWGQVMRLKLGAVDLPASGGPGRLGVFNVLEYTKARGAGEHAADFGGSYVALVSFASPVRAKVLLSYGESSEPGSPHNADQLPLLSQGRLRDAWRTRAEVEANLESRDTF